MNKIKDIKQMTLLICLILGSAFIKARQLELCEPNGERIGIVNIETPTYPTSPYYSIVEGFVELQVYVKSDGTVDKAMVVNASPKRKFNNSSLKAIKKSLFSRSLDSSLRCVLFTFQFKLD